PPKQKPIVNNVVTRASSATTSAAAVRISAEIPSHVVCATCGAYSKASWRVEAGRPPEPVERERIDARLGEAQGELLVVGMEPADIGQDHDAGPAGAR